MLFEIPESLKAEHRELHEQLRSIIHMGGPIGSAAKEVADLLDPHFKKEESFALPPLGLLERLVNGVGVTPDMAGVLRMTDRLKSEYGTVLAEHRQIVDALDELADAATQEGRPEIALFAEELKVHAATEEQVLYPAAILVGEYVRRELHK